MELSKEVHGLLERIKKLSQQVQKNESYSETPVNVSVNLSTKSFNLSVGGQEEINFSVEELIPVENMDFSDDERWLYVTENSMVNPFTGDLYEWLRQDFNKPENSIVNTFDFEPKIDFRKFIDTRTFTRPKKRISRPSLEQIADGCFSSSNSKSSISETVRDELRSSTSDDFSSESNHETVYSGSGPIHFKLSEPVYNSSFERILATASDSIDSFQNMSPPSLVNSLCSSTFTTLMDSGYVNQDLVPNEKESFCVPNEHSNENDDRKAAHISDNEKASKIKDLPLNDTYEIKCQNDPVNSTYAMIENDLNLTFQKNISNKSESPRYNLSNTSTFTKKAKPRVSSNSFKASCPDINKTSFHKNHDCTLDLTFQKLSDSQPNLTEDLKRTILNQSMELMNPSEEIFHSARSESADSLDERSSSISNSSKDSGTKILNMSDLDTLAKVQEKRLLQAMSTPNKPSHRGLVLEGHVLSPIQPRTSDEVDEYLSRSDSDMSDICLTARSRISRQSSPTRSNEDVRTVVRSHVARPRTSGAKPEMIVKPLEFNRRMVQPNRAQTAPNIVRPKNRASGLPRPTMATGIPRPMTRIPAPKSSYRPSLSNRPVQRQPPKSDWMDGCY